MNKIYYESEMQLSECIDNSMLKIKALKKWMRETKDEDVLDWLQEVVEMEKEAIQQVLDWVTVH